MRQLTSLFLFVVLTAGCTAGVAVHPVTNDERETGIRYYESAPYLLVHSDNEGGLTTRILYLPDMQKKMAARPYAKLASATMTLNFDKGVLTSATTSADSTKLATEVVGAIERAATAALPLILAGNSGDDAARQPTVPTPYLYRVVITDDQVRLVGGQPVRKDGEKIEPARTIRVGPIKGAVP